ncbi:MAG: DUF6794 domain-containing protein [Methylobacter sp.]
MTKNWSSIFNQNFQQPETIAEAVSRLMMILEGEQKVVLAIMQEEDLIELHFSFGRAIRNAFGLYEPESKLLASCHVEHPDDASGVIVKLLWDKLVEGSI